MRSATKRSLSVGRIGQLGALEERHRLCGVRHWAASPHHHRWLILGRRVFLALLALVLADEIPAGLAAKDADPVGKRIPTFEQRRHRHRVIAREFFTGRKRGRCCQRCLEGQIPQYRRLFQFAMSLARCVRSCGGIGCVCVRECWHSLKCVGDRNSSTNKSQLPPGQQAEAVLWTSGGGTRVILATHGTATNGRQQ